MEALKELVISESSLETIAQELSKPPIHPVIHLYSNPIYCDEAKYIVGKMEKILGEGIKINVFLEKFPDKRTEEALYIDLNWFINQSKKPGSRFNPSPQ